jgi:hypothetical protein
LKYIGELGEHTLGKGFMEKFRSGGGRRRRSPAGGTREERGGGNREERRIEEKEEGRWRPDHYAQKGASLVGTLLYFNGTSDTGALPAMWCAPGYTWNPLGTTTLGTLLPTYDVSLDGTLTLGPYME